MKNYWIHERKEVKAGDVIAGHKIARVTGQLHAEDGTVLAYDSWTGIRGPLAPHVSRIRIPDVVPFDRVTGERMREGSVSSLGWRVSLRSSYAYLYEVEPYGTPAYNISHIMDSRLDGTGVELRRNATVDEWFNGLPRVVNTTCAAGRTDYFVKGYRGSLIPAEDSVWTGRCYRKRSEFVVDCHNRLRLKSRFNHWPTLRDGTIAPPDRAVLLTSGPSSGAWERIELCDPCPGGWILRDEMVRAIDEFGRVRRVASAPADYVLLEDGRWCHPSAVDHCFYDGRAFCTHEAIRFDGQSYSPQGWELVGRFCDECGRAYINDGYSECHHCRADSRNRIRNYGNRSANSMIPERDVPIKFGIELEVGCDKGTDRATCAGLLSDAFELAGVDPQTYCVYKEDGSLCDCNGLEIVTRPDCPSVHKRVFGAALADKRLRGRMSSYDNGHCGMHIHVSRAPLNELWVGRLLVLVNSDNMKRMLRAVAGRSGNRYTTYDPFKKLTSVKSCTSRYEALNVTGDHTIEFRMFRGTLNPVSFVKNIEFVEAAIAYTRTATRSLRGLDDPSAFRDFVIKSRKAYPNLAQFLISRP